VISSSQKCGMQEAITGTCYKGTNSSVEKSAILVTKAWRQDGSNRA